MQTFHYGFVPLIKPMPRSGANTSAKYVAGAGTSASITRNYLAVTRTCKRYPGRYTHVSRKDRRVKPRTLPKGLSDYALCDNGSPKWTQKHIWSDAYNRINRNLWLQSYRLTFECGHWYIRAMKMTLRGDACIQLAETIPCTTSKRFRFRHPTPYRKQRQLHSFVPEANVDNDICFPRIIRKEWTRYKRCFEGTFMRPQDSMNLGNTFANDRCCRLVTVYLAKFAPWMNNFLETSISASKSLYSSWGHSIVVSNMNSDHHSSFAPLCVYFCLIGHSCALSFSSQSCSPIGFTCWLVVTYNSCQAKCMFLHYLPENEMNQDIK